MTEPVHVWGLFVLGGPQDGFKIMFNSWVTPGETDLRRACARG